MAGVNPNINPVNMMGANTTLPPELQAEQAQIQLRQEIAQAMLGQSLGDQSPVIHTGGSNPFARDVANIGGPIGQVAEALMGRNLMNKVGSQQLDIAKRYQDTDVSQRAAVMKELMGYDLGVPGPDGQTPVHRGGDALRAASVNTTIPAVRELQGAILKAFIENQAKQTPTGGDILSSGRNLDPQSVGNSLTPGLFGSRVDASKLVPKATVTMAPDGSMGTTLPLAGALTQGAGILRRPPEGLIKPGDPISTNAPPGSVPQPGVPGPATTSPLSTVDSPTGRDTTNDTNADLTRDPTGKLTVLETPRTKAASEVADLKAKDLAEGAQGVQKSTSLIPRMGQALDLISAVGPEGFGITGPWKQKARQVAVDFGVAPEEAAKVTNLQTFLKLTVQPIINQVHQLSSRPSQLEFQNISEKLAGDINITPAAATNVFRSFIVDALNESAVHQKNLKNARENTAIGKNADAFKAPTPDEIMMSGGLKDVKSPMTFKQDSTGMFRDAGITQQTDKTLEGRDISAGGTTRQFMNKQTGKLETFNLDPTGTKWVPQK